MLVAFGYDFPHRKTADGLYRLVAHGIRVDCFIAAPHKNLNLRKALLNGAPKASSLKASAEICSDLGIEYWHLPHESPEAIRLIEEMKPDWGVVLGARILPSSIIEGFSIGILNLHPGLLPFNAGLYNVEWAINQNFPQGVTAHLIDASVDAGKLIKHSMLESLPRDFRMTDLRATLSEMELQIAVDVLSKNRFNLKFADLKDLAAGLYHRPLSRRAEVTAQVRWARYVQNYPRLLDEFQKNYGFPKLP